MATRIQTLHPAVGMLAVIIIALTAQRATWWAGCCGYLPCITQVRATTNGQQVAHALLNYVNAVEVT